MKKPSQAEVLLELAAGCQPFHTPQGVAFVDVKVADHRETWPVRSTGFRQWLCGLYYRHCGGAPNTNALQSALGVIEARARYEVAEQSVYLRTAEHDGRLYLDLCDRDWRAVEIEASGWRVVREPPVRFRRAQGMRPLPTPVRGGSINALRQFLNLKDDADFVLVVAWALAVLRNRGPYPVLILAGEQGSAKSTFAAILRALLDPNTAPLRALPREARDFFIAATNGHILSFDNISSLPPATSDTICRLATGGGFAVRQLYSDGDEVIFAASRPIILNGIEDVATRADLADRAIFLTLEPISDLARRPEADLWAAFSNAHSLMLGALLDAVAVGLRELPTTHLSRLPRMADFARWATACETALWPAGSFWAAYTGNRAGAIETVLEADPVATAIRDLVMKSREWKGTAGQLLEALNGAVSEPIRKSQAWPGTPRALSGRLQRAATFLREAGVTITKGREGATGTRSIRLSATSVVAADSMGRSSSAPSVSSEPGALPKPPSSCSDDADGADGRVKQESSERSVKGAAWRVQL